MIESARAITTTCSAPFSVHIFSSGTLYSQKAAGWKEWMGMENGMGMAWNRLLKN
jgi:hypothetical protein